MAHTVVRLLVLSALLMIAFAVPAFAQDCSGVVTGDEALKAERARYAAQTTNDFAAMEKLLAGDLTYIHSSAAIDSKASFIDSMRSGRVKYRKITPNGDVKTRAYGCLAIITGSAVYEVTVGGQERSIPLRFHAIWAKRPSGLEFVSWQATGIPK